ncbi:MAG: two-component system, chemotaxis family, response regulator CheY [Marinobacter excellens HL-55]|uniref:Two-component system, chemotaxis family, response regulator CheY n=1 Tax=Marinobacter excellens HL-55 TaxID=1305731 RepID=A0A0P8BJF0_9GAMM|nr:MAG: two-component system, chemotaxis family, response regulator CheY [Marinobacter excellens HL-55]
MTKTVMVVDDSASLRQVVVMALKSAGYETIEAENGKKALEVLKAKRANLIISDVNMPVMDGLTFLKEVKKLPDYKFTPVIMLTTESSENRKSEGKASGAKAWVVKPFQPQQMLDAVKKLLLM